MYKDYEHHAQYYETDQMGCVHHSNYIRWMEEARVNLMEQMGCGYKAIRMTLAYEMRDTATGELKTTGESRHCFLDTEGRPVSLKRYYPQWDTAFRNAVRAQDARQ
ncbi:acyl-CoA thioester hydrolase [Enterocloster clostridioformis]|uniref:acyl-CoA thioesterase n=1 Tax=Enterocloster clostridioformis TaxID=1531 RepID=UPI00080CA85D|nr:acyl-CoA thioesterase [Enterocloster clostridioformis]ANU45897.1 acyl-CoA thioester hydrolase [Lachnoclostridium sp. YL32]NDO30241.1 acyl-CoA thioesterase [Enterocloster clostridioformis]OXE67599.1 acyl-CoA thioester hydrolase [Enterocloster clostridioformis]QQQ99349.1 acyl-CoA thioesterase [Enterocloster clostridioformis]